VRNRPLPPLASVIVVPRVGGADRILRYAIIASRLMMNIYVGNLPYTTTEDNLREAFSAYGEVSSVSLITDKFSGESKGFGFVEMSDNSEADAAIKGLNGSMMGNRTMKVNQAKPRGDRPPKRGGGGGGRW
jgi:RNA recognition motif-containing protein